MDEAGTSEPPQADVHSAYRVEARELFNLLPVENAKERKALKHQEIARLENKPARPTLQVPPLLLL